MFFETQSLEDRGCYEKLLKVMGALSRLSSDSDIPYLYYRMAENIFCKAFGAINLARSDISLDAKKLDKGFGLKTFINKRTGSIEKIAEFNRNKHLIDDVSGLRDKINFIANLRNERLRVTSGIASVNIDNMIYHCVLREKEKFIIHENRMLPINIDNIANIRETSNNIVSFCDGIYEYSFNFSKSTLYKRFIPNPIHEFSVQIIEDPYEMLSDALSHFIEISSSVIRPAIERIYLPLYSYNRSRGCFVPERSGLNQWNANGRPRNYNEVYIPIPIAIRNNFPNFFPDRDTAFTLRLPSGAYLMAKVCQDSGKALMSNPNSALGEWLLRIVLGLDEGELLTYNKLEKIGIDTVEVTKFSDNTYEINFKKLGTYKEFEERSFLLDEENQ